MLREMRSKLLGLMLLGGLAACSDSPTAPNVSGGGDSGSTTFPVASITSEFEVQVASDSVSSETAVEDMILSLDSPPEDASSPFAEARRKYAEARAAFRRGDLEAAKALAAEARGILARTLIELRGEEGLARLFARVENLIERLQMASDEFEQLDRLQNRLVELVEEARSLENEGNLVAAAERLLLGLQIADVMRHRHRDFVLNPPIVARLAIARAVEALQLAERLIGEDPTFMQERVLFHVGELIRRAQFAAEHDAFRRAVDLARRAESLSLLAVLEFERPTVEDARELLSVAETMIAEAEAAIGDDPTPAQAAILQRAKRLKAAGEELITNGVWRGVGLLWQAAVTAGVLF